jgi:hypothetical protein
MCQRVLERAGQELPTLKPRLTAGDFDLIPGLTTSDVDAFEREKLEGLTKGRGWEGVEDIYPASGMQQGLLMSRGKDEGFYAVRRWVSVSKTRGEGRVEVERLMDAWSGVVRHHALLRTVFVEALSQEGAGGFDQGRRWRHRLRCIATEAGRPLMWTSSPSRWSRWSTAWTVHSIALLSFRMKIIPTTSFLLSR